MNIKKYQMSLKQYRAFYSVQCRRIKKQVKNINVKCLSEKLRGLVFVLTLVKALV